MGNTPSGPGAETIRAHLDQCPKCAELYADFIGEARTIQGINSPGPEGETSPARTVVAETPARIGRFLVLGTIGEGGMGSVVSAYDPELDRKVAIKILRFDLAAGRDSRGLQDRLRVEARTMARLSHPNVVQVFDVGTHQDGAYIAMEWVNGSTLWSWQTQPRGWREILSVYLQAGRGLVAAHQAGLIHRDFKPDNVLIDKHDNVRVTDFGLARRDVAPEQRNESTSPGMVVGTPGYMPPEQIRGAELDARADQFAFCVSLYQALYRQAPFRGQSFLEISKEVLETEPLPPPPGGSVPHYLWPLLRKGMSKSPDHRFPDLSLLLRQLERDPAVRLRWIAVGGAALLAASAGALWEGGRVARENRRCGEEARAAASFWNPSSISAIQKAFLAIHKPYANVNYLNVQQTMEEQVQRWVHDEAELCELLRKQPGDRDTFQRQETLQRRLGALQAAASVFSSADEVGVKNAPVSLEAIHAEEFESKVARPVVNHFDADASRQVEQARLLQAEDRLAEAQRVAEAGLKLARERGDGESEARGLWIQGLLAEDQQGDLERAQSLLRQADLRAESVRADEVSAAIRIDLMEIAEESERDSPLLDEASDRARAAVARLGDPPAYMADWLISRAMILARKGRFDEGRDAMQKALELDRQVLGADGYRTAQALFNFAGLERERGDWKESLALLESSAEIIRRVEGPDHPDLARQKLAMATVLQELSRDEEAMEQARDAERIFEEAEGNTGEFYAESLSMIASSQVHLNHLKEARASAEQANAILEKLDPSKVDPAAIFRSTATLADIELRAGQRDDAARYAEEAYDMAHGHPAAQAQAAFLLSEILGSVPGSRAKALDLAREAKALLPTTDREATEVDAWLAQLQKKGAGRH